MSNSFFPLKKKLNVMVVEDEMTILMHLEHYLNLQNEVASINAYQSSVEALAMFNRSFDIAFLDINMPEINGLELALELQEMNPSIKICFVTAYSQYAVEAFKLNAIHYLLKPFDEDDIQTVLKRMLVLNRHENIQNNLVKIQWFDRFEIQLMDDTVVQWPTQKTAELCCYFLLNSHKTLLKQEIIEALWPEMEYSKTNQNFHTSLFRLREVLKNHNIGIHIQSHQGSQKGYMCTTQSIDLDYYPFDKATMMNAKDWSSFLLNKSASFLSQEDWEWLRPIKHQVNNHLYSYIFNMIENESLHHVMTEALPIVDFNDELINRILNHLDRTKHKTLAKNICSAYQEYLKLTYNDVCEDELLATYRKLVD